MVTRFNFRKVARKFLATVQVHFILFNPFLFPRLDHKDLPHCFPAGCPLISSFFQTLFGRGQDRQRFQLFSSSVFGENDLLFKDATQKLAVLPDDMDVSQVLGLDYVALLKGLGHEGADSAWCACLAVILNAR